MSCCGIGGCDDERKSAQIANLQPLCELERLAAAKPVTPVQSVGFLLKTGSPSTQTNHAEKPGN